MLVLCPVAGIIEGAADGRGRGRQGKKCVLRMVEFLGLIQYTSHRRYVVAVGD